VGSLASVPACEILVHRPARAPRPRGVEAWSTGNRRNKSLFLACFLGRIFGTRTTRRETLPSTARSSSLQAVFRALARPRIRSADISLRFQGGMVPLLASHSALVSVCFSLLTATRRAGCTSQNSRGLSWACCSPPTPSPRPTKPAKQLSL
jgi:hypothetical protein